MIIVTTPTFKTFLSKITIAEPEVDSSSSCCSRNLNNSKIKEEVEVEVATEVEISIEVAVEVLVGAITIIITIVITTVRILIQTIILYEYLP